MPDLSAGRPLPLPEKIFTEEDIELVALAITNASGGVYDNTACWARYVLEALAAAGRLLPPDAEHREEWTYRAEINGHGQRGEDGAEVFDTHEEVVDFVTSWSRTYPSMSVTNARYVTRTVLAGSWVEVDRSTDGV